MTCGVLYIATGEKYIKEASNSAESVNNQMPDIDTAIATSDIEQDLSTFDQVIELEKADRTSIDGRQWLINSTIGPNLSPFDRTLYLDSDTRVCTDISEVFDMLNDFDLVMARTPGRTHESSSIPEVPEMWDLYNCGVIGYRNSLETKEFLKRWREVYRDLLEKQDHPEDQPAFLKALYHSENLQWFTLPRRYNVRFPRRGALNGEVKIIHGRHRKDLKEIVDELNKVDGQRVFRERSYLFSPATTVHNRGTIRFHIEKNLVENGFSETVRLGIKYITERLSK
jgi:hypothetical protein